jgi:hypothetical protein
MNELSECADDENRKSLVRVANQLAITARAVIAAGVAVSPGDSCSLLYLHAVGGFHALVVDTTLVVDIYTRVA